MGGGVVLLIANKLGSNKFFKGCILLAPLIKLNIPFIAKPIVNLLASIMPTNRLPKFIIDENTMNSYIWNNSNYIKYISDSSYNKGGISYGENIRFRTLLSIIELSEQIQKELPKINYNVLIIHDKKDIVISKASIEMIKNKKYINIKDGRHDILANKPYIVTSHIINWINEDIV